MKWIRWLFWCAVYAVLPTPKTLHAYIVRGERRRAPWWKFEPCVHPVGDRQQLWQVYLENESFYVDTPSVLVPVRLYITHDDARVIGFEVAAKSLREHLKGQANR